MAAATLLEYEFPPLTSGGIASLNLVMRKSAGRKPTAPGKAAPSETGARQPVASRPAMPGYGVSQSAKGMLDWSWAQERLTNSHNYVIVTVRPDGRPHAMGMHGLWFEDAFSSAPVRPRAKRKTWERIRTAFWSTSAWRN